MSLGIAGIVVAFDEAVGLGLVSDESGHRWPFHCVSIADGTRVIDVGAKVTFRLRFCTLRREAVSIEPAPQ